MGEEVYPRMSVEEAREVILQHVRPLEPEEVSILDALGRVLAQDVYADTDIPPLSNSAMDGYALRSQDTRGATGESPVTLRVIYNLAAGYTSDVEVTEGTAVRIMTGAPIPKGADAVIQFERTEELGDRVRVLEFTPVGANVRPAGEDVRKGELVLSRGTEIHPAEMGMLAALGKARVRVTRRPRVGILATGDEVIDIEAPLMPGKIRNANSYSNAGQVRQYGGIPVLLGIARDDMDSIRERLRRGLAEELDLLLTSGGVSVGDFDVVKEVLRADAEITFWQVKMRPGKPMAFGQIGGVPLLGLPGNPVSAMVSFEMFARPAIAKMLGKSDIGYRTLRARLAEDVDTRAGFCYFLRVTLERDEEGYIARLTGEQGSGILRSMVKADGLAVVPEDRSGMSAGEEVEVILLR